VLYKKMYDSAPDQFIKDMDERDERSRHYRQFDAQRIRSFSSDELIEYLGKLWAMRMWGNKHYNITRVIEDTGFERLKEEIANRRLVPDELDQIQTFPKGWTADEGDGKKMTDGHRAFCMGNTLVVGIPHKIGVELFNRL